MTLFRSIKVSHIAPPLIVALLGCTTMSSAHAGWFDFGSDAKTPDTKSAADAAKPGAPRPAADLDQAIRQAQMLRMAGNYDEAVHSLSQMMLVASDDPRVISEYGKTLAAMGRASDAVQFLTRATQLSPTDWTVYSALGVAYDQLGKQPEAQSAYERALVIKPGEPSVLNNYALSRMLAHDPDMARKLASRAQVAGGESDPKIARNLAMIGELAPADTGDKPYVIAKPAPTPPGASVAKAAPSPAMTAPLVATPQQERAQTQPPPRMAANMPAPAGAPRQLVTPPANAPIEALPQPAPQKIVPRGVVMQAVPYDPYAGPVAPPVKSLHPPKALAAAEPMPQAAPPKAEARTETRPQGKPETKAAEAAARPAPRPADTAPKPNPPKAVAKAGNSIPALRLSANAY